MNLYTFLLCISLNQRSLTLEVGSFIWGENKCFWNLRLNLSLDGINVLLTIMIYWFFFNNVTCKVMLEEQAFSKVRAHSRCNWRVLNCFIPKALLNIKNWCNFFEIFDEYPLCITNKWCKIFGKQNALTWKHFIFKNAPWNFTFYKCTKKNLGGFSIYYIPLIEYVMNWTWGMNLEHCRPH